MGNTDSNPGAESLSQKAEELLKKKSATPPPQHSLSETETVHLLHELEVQQIELELQKDELNHVITGAKDDFELYDFAPIGYFVLSRAGEILRVNLNGSQMLGKDRKELVNSHLGLFIADASKPVFHHFVETIFHSDTKESCELLLSPDNGKTTYVQLIGTASGKGAQCRLTMIDITDRRLLENKLLTERAFRNSIELSLSSGIAIADKDGRQIYVNPSFCELLGYSETDLLGKTAPYVYWPPEHFQAIDEAFRITLANKAPKGGFELVFMRKDGTYVPVQVIISPFSDGSHLTGWLANVIDITDRKMAEEALEKSKKFANDIIGSMQDGVSVLDRNGVHILVNASLCNMTGFSCEELIGTGIPHPYWPEEEYEHLDNAFLQTMEKEDNSFELVFKRKNGERFPVLVSPFAIHDNEGNIVNYSATFKDITRRKQIETLMKESEEKLRTVYQYARSLIEASLDPLVTIDADGKITDVNAATEKIMELTRDHLIGTEFSQYFTEGEHAKVGYHQVFEQGSVVDYPLTIRSSSGRLTDVLYNASVYRDGQGKILGIFAAARDITARKQAENELNKLNETLEQRIAERTHQLETINEELAFHLNELEQFAYITNHDLQEPLRTLVNFTQLVKDEYMGKLDEDGNRYIDFIYTSAGRMRDLVNGLFDYSLIGKQSVAEIIDCNRIVGEVLKDLQKTIRENNAKITVRQLPTLNGFEAELRLLFQNLIANAIKFKKKDTDPEISISAESQEKGWMFSIRDNGIGIEAQHKDKIFIIFQRLHNRDDYKGTGIGLAHCKKVVELHGGKIWVDSTPGAGCIFNFTIPKVLSGKGNS